MVPITCRYTLAIKRRVPSTFSSGVLAPGASSVDICFATARHQHAAYIDILRRYVDRSRHSARSRQLPDSLFVKDAAVVLPCEDSRAVAVQGTPAHLTSRAEAAVLTPSLHACGLRVVKLPPSPGAKDAATAFRYSNGRDVLYAHAHRALFVCLSHRTGASASSGTPQPNYCFLARFTCSPIIVFQVYPTEYYLQSTTS